MKGSYDSRMQHVIPNAVTPDFKLGSYLDEMIEQIQDNDEYK